MIGVLAAVLLAVIDPGASAYDIVSDDGCQQEFFSVPPNIASSSVGLVPGGSDFYGELFWRDGMTWTVRTNRHVVAVTNAAIGPFYETGNKYRSVYDWTSVVSSLGLTPTNTAQKVEWSPSLFDFTIDAYTSGGAFSQVRFTENGEGTNRSFSTFYPDGRMLYQPRSMRLTPDNYMALVSTYAAYFERLYYASEGQTNVWNVADYGALYPGQGFAFNVSNASYCANCYFDFNVGSNRSVSSSRWLVEWKNLCNIRHAVRDGFLATDGAAAAVPQVNAALLYRPKWLLDRSAQPTGANNGRVWWSSTFYPPTVKIGPTVEHPGIWQDPQNDGFGFFPTFEWTETPIATKVQGAGEGWYWQQAQDWATKCVTLHMAAGGAHDNPCAALFDAVGYDGDAPLNEIVKPYDFGMVDGLNVQRWMTNAWPLAVSMYYPCQQTWEDYVAGCWGSLGELTTTRRLAANDYTGVNELLAAMNRTIQLPSMKTSSTNEVTSVERRAYYLSPGVTISYSVNVNGFVTLTDGSKQGTVVLNKQSESNLVSTAVRAVADGISVKSTSPSLSLVGQFGRNMQSRNAYTLPESLLAVYAEEGTNLAHMISAQNSLWGIDVTYEMNGTQRSSFIPKEVSEATGVAYIGASGVRSYQFEEPSSVVTALGPTQPGASSAGRIDEAGAVSLARVAVYRTNTVTNVATTNEKYKASTCGAFTNRRTLEQIVDAKGIVLANEAVALAHQANGGFNPSTYDAYAPFKSTVTSTYELNDNYSPIVFESFIGDEHKTVTNQIFYTMGSSTNAYVYRVVCPETDTYMLYHAYDVTLTYYDGSGTMKSNVVDNGTSEQYVGYEKGDETTEYEGSVGEDVELMYGPFNEDPVSVLVENWRYNILDYYNRIYRNDLLLDAVTTHTIHMSGTGPDSPGEIVSTETDERTDYRGESGPYFLEEYFENEEKTPVESYMTDTPTSEAIRKEGEGIVTLTGQHMVRFVKSGGAISGIHHYLHWFNPVTGKQYGDVAAGWPMNVASYYFVLDIGSTLSGGIPQGGCKTDVDETADHRVLTQIEWKWKNLRAE